MADRVRQATALAGAVAAAIALAIVGAAPASADAADYGDPTTRTIHATTR